MRSSSSSAPDASFASFLTRSLELLARELPWVYTLLCAALSPREVSIEVDGEISAVFCSTTSLRVTQRPEAPVVECRTSRAAIVDLIDARLTLVQAVVEDRVWLRGDVDELLAFHDGLMIFLGGAVRSPSFPGLLREFRLFSARKPGVAPIDTAQERL